MSRIVRRSPEGEDPSDDVEGHARAHLNAGVDPEDAAADGGEDVEGNHLARG